MSAGTQIQPRRELRIALVLYGGVSLCIYMHGTTKEVNKLVSASRRLALGERDGASASEVVYIELLADLAKQQSVRTDVVVDVIAGTSAGGINGVYLAKALARNLSQNKLRDLWMQKGNIDLLLRGPRHIPWQLRAPVVIARIKKDAPLRGDAMSAWLYEALTPMNETSSTWAATLMPDGTTLDLLVTTTDFHGYDRQIPIADPPIVHDTQHRHVLHFRHTNRSPRFGKTDDVSLALAARVTSSFPGAFGAVDTAGFTRDAKADGHVDASLFRVYELAGANYADTYFIDGGVLDNRPFAPAIEAIRAKPAAVDVRRHVIYLEPDPQPPLRIPQEARPGPLKAIAGAIARLPRQQPIIDSLIEIRQMNHGVREIRDAIEAAFPVMRGRISADGEPTRRDTATPDPDQKQGRHEEAADSADSYRAYIRLRVLSLLDTIATAICAVLDYPPESNHALLVASSLRAWAVAQGLDPGVEFTDERTLSQQLEFLAGLDIDFARRRVRFTLNGINWLYNEIPTLPPADAPSADTELARRERLRFDTAKTRLWEELGLLEEVLTRAIEQRGGELTACFPEAEMLKFLQDTGVNGDLWWARVDDDLDRLMGALREMLVPQLQDRTRSLEHGLGELLAEFTDERRRDLLVRYREFPAWDVRLFTLEVLAAAGERDAIDVVRSSPRDATLLWPPGTQKLQGITLMHFGAFFSLGARENDYLVGRLDGAERLIKLLVRDENAQASWCARAFIAILKEEDDLATTTTIREHVQARAGELL